MVMRLSTLFAQLAETGAITVPNESRLINAVEDIAGDVPEELIVDQNDGWDDDDDDSDDAEDEDDDTYGEDDEDEEWDDDED